MISGELVGRLGNQMFIIATTHSLASDNGDVASFSKKIGGITPTNREVLLHRKTILRNVNYVDDLSFIKHIHRESSDFSYSKPQYKDGLCLVGYFQSEKYFKHNRDKILELFKPQEQINDFLLKKYSNIMNNKKYVSVHIRRGDYLKFADYHTNLEHDYYDKAMNQFSDDHKFVFFSDDIEWCKETFTNKNNIFIEKQDDILDLYLMSKITNNIIANSSFSWWAAWLNENKNKKVIAPSNWFGVKNSHLDKRNLLPEEWQTI